MQEIVPFDFQGNPVRVIKDERGEPWWTAVDVCRVLGLDQVSRALSRLDNDEKTTLTISTGHIEQGLSDNAPGTSLNLVNEPGLYRLILTSRKPEAKAFSRWVTHDVLPTIRKTGSYVASQEPTPSKPALRDVAQRNREIADLAQSYSTLYRVMGLRGQQRFVAVETVLRARHGIELDRIAPLPCPVQYPDTTIADRLVSPTELGRALGRKAVEINRTLENLGLQTRQGKSWQPTDKANGLWEWVKIAMHHAPLLRWRENAILEHLQRRIATH
ncbi:BRO-N domain-containing protein [Acidithiobacillus ferriphilus]|uniref:BRO-N domain-containing protein n=1 Tax=Acidithiobacillus ferriphilus TaxID=1689834 RepID=UPI001C066966|nr:BRO family protein [Acidithiobacillus ferriphilus]MBU2853351.1 hypothetical protein [Acidithiobacillus ferriphilus]